MRKRIGMLLVMTGFTAAASLAQAQDVVLKPQQLIQFRPGAYGCLSKDKFDAADHHAQTGEQQKMQQFFAGFECVSAPENSEFRIVRVVGHDVEFVNAGNTDTQGLWTHDRFIKQ